MRAKTEELHTMEILTAVSKYSQRTKKKVNNLWKIDVFSEMIIKIMALMIHSSRAQIGSKLLLTLNCKHEKTSFLMMFVYRNNI